MTTQITKRISTDNGSTYTRDFTRLEPRYLDTDWDVLVNAMDDDTRERVHAELAPCSNTLFLARYLELAPDDLVIG
jgi:hypothetical protein